MTNEDFKQWLRDMRYSNRRAAERLGVSVRTIEGYKSNKPIPTIVWHFCNTLQICKELAA